MSRLRSASINVLAALGLILTTIQILMHFRGQELCFNQGCKIVEGILKIDPFTVNGAGCLFFVAVLALAAVKKKRRDLEYLFDFVLLCGFVAEGILLSIQLFIARTFCSYCLLVASLILLITIIHKYRIAIFGTAFVTIELAVFSFINIPFVTPESVNLNQGTYAVKTCSGPTSVAFLIFSEDCPHCKKVLGNLQGCVRCEIHFNPISKIDKEILPGLVPIEGYRPEVNVLALKIFDINSVPVLIQRTDDGYKIIKGDERILEFIKNQCFCPGSAVPGLPTMQNPSLFEPGEEGVCSLEEQCK